MFSLTFFIHKFGELSKRLCKVYYESLYNLCLISKTTDKVLATQLADKCKDVALKSIICSFIKPFSVYKREFLRSEWHQGYYRDLHSAWQHFNVNGKIRRGNHWFSISIFRAKKITGFELKSRDSVQLVDLLFYVSLIVYQHHLFINLI